MPEDLKRVEDRLAGLETSTSFQFGEMSQKLNGLKDMVQLIAERPQAGVPVWLIVLVSVPSALVAVSSLLIAVYLVTQ